MYVEIISGLLCLFVHSIVFLYLIRLLEYANPGWRFSEGLWQMQRGLVVFVDVRRTAEVLRAGDGREVEVRDAAQQSLGPEPNLAAHGSRVVLSPAGIRVLVPLRELPGPLEREVA